MNQAYSRLPTTHGHITDCKLDSVVYASVCVSVNVDLSCLGRTIYARQFLGAKPTSRLESLAVAKTSAYSGTYVCNFAVVNDTTLKYHYHTRYHVHVICCYALLKFTVIVI